MNASRAVLDPVMRAASCSSAAPFHMKLLTFTALCFDSIMRPAMQQMRLCVTRPFTIRRHRT